MFHQTISLRNSAKSAGDIFSAKFSSNKSAKIGSIRVIGVPSNHNSAKSTGDISRAKFSQNKSAKISSTYVIGVLLSLDELGHERDSCAIFFERSFHPKINPVKSVYLANFIGGIAVKNGFLRLVPRHLKADIDGKLMTTNYNEIFKNLLTEYNLTEDFSFSVDLPKEVQKILNDQILITDLGVTLKSFNRLYKATKDWENQSIIEDSENHFHVDWYLESADNKKVFMLGVKTLTLLADKFQKEKIKGIRCWYSYQTPELGRLWSKQNNLEEDDVEQFISDRLSFYKLRDGENVISTNENENKFWAILTIDL